LAAALARALESRNEISRLGQHARRTVIERFSEDTMVDRHVRLYQGLLRDR
jgi:glycosyltransferase involved in cell wall biosynthesis